MGIRSLYQTLVERETPPADRTDQTQLEESTLTQSPVTTEDWFWGRIGSSGSEEDYFWRRLSDNWTQKDVLPATYLEIHNQVYEAYNANPMANAIVEMGVNFTLGDGLQIDAKSKKVQKILDAFWHDPDNRMNLRQYELATELSLYGELFVRWFVNPYNGHCKIGLIDPSLIDEIDCDRDNIERQLRCHRRALGNLNSPQVSATTPAAPDQAGSWVDGEWFDMPSEVMHFSVNKVSNAKRGKSDLATLLPWLRRYKDWLIDRVRINKYKAAFLWDIELAGADRKSIEQKMMEYARPPEPGSIIVHNESEKWSAVQPNIQAGDAAADGNAIKIMVAMGAGIPEHYLSEGGDVNRATAAEMGLPTLKKFQRRQDFLGFMLRAILDRVVEEAMNAGALPRGVDTSYELRFPDLKAQDTKDIGTAAWHMAQALAIVGPMDIVSRETAAHLFYGAVRSENDWKEELEKIADDPMPAQPSAVSHQPSAPKSTAQVNGPPPSTVPVDLRKEMKPSGSRERSA